MDHVNNIIVLMEKHDDSACERSFAVPMYNWPHDEDDLVYNMLRFIDCSPYVKESVMYQNSRFTIQN